MSTDHELPWSDENDWVSFRETLELLRHLEFTRPEVGRSIDGLAWRHWIVAYAARHAVRHSGIALPVFAECGVGDGLTALVALREGRPAEFHLFDAWQGMVPDLLSEEESSQAGNYADSARDRTERNLAEHLAVLRIHQGFVPATLVGPPPVDLCYLHIDLNSATPTVEALKYFWPALVSGGVMLFDDYGWRYYHETREAVDRFFLDKPGTLMKLPTGQALYFR